MPRLSVDLDLAFVDHTVPREQALTRINDAILQAGERLKKRGFQIHVPPTAAGETRLLVRRGHIEVKIEVNFVLRGTVRPVHEVLFPKLKHIQHEYQHNFVGMTSDPVPLNLLLATRDRMIRELQTGLDDSERKFLLSLVACEPNWSLPGIDHLEHLPAIQWKLHNLVLLKNTNPKKFAEQVDELATRLKGVAVPVSKGW